MAYLIPSLPINEKVTHACVTNSPKWGSGVFSWHKSEKEAKHNAKITGGMSVPIDRINGELIIPSAATKAIMDVIGGR